MSKTALIVFAGTDSHADLGRVFNALETTREFIENGEGDDVKLIFDGAGTQWIPELEDPEHDAHPIYDAVKGSIAGACRFCSKSFGVFEEVQQSDIDFLADFNGHPSIKSLVDDGYEVVTF